MQKHSQKYTIAYIFDTLPDGYEYAKADWPLHVTLSDVFSITGSLDDLFTNLRTQLFSFKPFITTVIGEGRFGDDRSVRVMLLNRTRELQQLHLAIVALLERYGAQFNNEAYIREGYMPHSSIRKGMMLEVGDEVYFNSVSVIDLFPYGRNDTRKILRTIRFE